MNNPYLAPCRYCGGTVAPESGTVERVGQSFQAAHLACLSQRQNQFLSLLCAGAVPQAKRRGSLP